jgi:hypothetical protein
VEPLLSPGGATQESISVAVLSPKSAALPLSPLSDGGRQHMKGREQSVVASQSSDGSAGGGRVGASALLRTMLAPVYDPETGERLHVPVRSFEGAEPTQKKEKRQDKVMGAGKRKGSAGDAGDDDVDDDGDDDDDAADVDDDEIVDFFDEETVAMPASSVPAEEAAEPTVASPTARTMSALAVFGTEERDYMRVLVDVCAGACLTEDQQV